MTPKTVHQDSTSLANEKTQQLQNRITDLEEEIASRQQVAEMTTQYMKQIQDELGEKNTQISQINKKLTDSINYALRIQKAVTPSEESLKQHFPESFVIYRPQSILSGDIPWVEQIGQYKLIAAIDCTGHGVPGAMLSILAFSLLKKIVTAENANNPAAILRELDKSIYEFTNNEDMELQIRDGMDVALLCIDTESGVGRFAGAHRPLLFFRDNVLNEIKGARYSLGENDPKRVARIKNNDIQFQQEDILYLFSDGYADQFGGEEKQKFSVGKFKKMLRTITNMNMQEQQQQLLDEHEQWKGNLQQTDDILIVALKIDSPKK